MELSDFDFDLPEELIALRPVVPRSGARLLVADGADLQDRDVRALPQVLRPSDLLVFNDTAVIPARLSGVRTRQTSDGSGTARIEVTLLEPRGDADWLVLAKPTKRLRAGDRIVFSDDLSAEVLALPGGGEVILRFDAGAGGFDAALNATGDMPLPPYIAGRRAADARDKDDYQTVFARRKGAVAAPTASLHFDSDLMAALDRAGIERTFVTLHVGAGTFLPVRSDRIDAHKMHAEWGEVTDAAAGAIAEAKQAGRRVIPVGTTALRLVEAASQPHTGLIQPWRGKTDIFIRPGHRFAVADGLMTNFHLPKSTLLMLVAALIGLERTHAVYRHAIAQRYRFFSYGDASLLFP